MSSESAISRALIRVGLPALAGGTTGYLSAEDENKLMSALMGIGIGGGIGAASLIPGAVSAA